MGIAIEPGPVAALPKAAETMGLDQPVQRIDSILAALGLSKKVWVILMGA